MFSATCYSAGLSPSRQWLHSTQNASRTELKAGLLQSLAVFLSSLSLSSFCICVERQTTKPPKLPCCPTPHTSLWGGGVGGGELPAFWLLENQVMLPCAKQAGSVPAGTMAGPESLPPSIASTWQHTPGRELTKSIGSAYLVISISQQSLTNHTVHGKKQTPTSHIQWISLFQVCRAEGQLFESSQI